MPLVPAVGGHVHRNMAVLDRLGETQEGALTHKDSGVSYAGGGVTPASVLSTQSVKITSQMVTVTGFEFDAEYDPQKPVTLSMTGSPALIMGADFSIQQHEWPQKDVLSWAGFPDSESAILAGDSATFSYYRRV